MRQLGNLHSPLCAHNGLGSISVSTDHLQADVLLTTGGLKSMQEIDVEQSINADLRSVRPAAGLL